MLAIANCTQARVQSEAGDALIPVIVHVKRFRLARGMMQGRNGIQDGHHGGLVATPAEFTLPATF